MNIHTLNQSAHITFPLHCITSIIPHIVPHVKGKDTKPSYPKTHKDVRPSPHHYTLPMHELAHISFLFYFSFLLLYVYTYKYTYTFDLYINTPN